MLRRLQHHLIRSVLQIQAGEELRVGLMLLYSIAVVGGVIITGQTVSRVLFLSALPQAAVPYKYILPPVALLLTSAVLTRAADRFRSDHLIIGSYSVVLLGMAAFWLLLQTRWRTDFWALCALFVYIDIVASLVILQFWTFAGEIFNSREAKRLFALISGGSTVSNVLFGAFITSISNAVDPADLVFVVMASLGLCIVCVWILGRRYQATLVEAGAGESTATRAVSGSMRKDLLDVLRNPLVRTMSLILILVALVSNIGDYQLDLGLQARYGSDSQGMVGFLGQFRLWAGLAAGILQFLLAGRLMERFGVVAVLLLLPSAMILGATSILLTGGLVWAAAAPRACDVVLKYSINDPAFNLLYLPIQPRLRAKARAILDGIMKPPAVTLLGLVFLWAGPSGNATIVHWAYVILALVGVWMTLVVYGGHQYVAALSQSIRFRRLAPGREQMDLTDERAIRVIRATLSAPEAPRVIHALDLLPQIPRVDWTADVALLLDRPDPEVRLMALRFLGEHDAAIYAEEVVSCLGDTDERVRAAAVETLCALGKLQVIPRILPFLNDPSPRIRGAAVLGLIKHTGLDGFLHAGEHLKALLTSPDPAARLEAARVLEALQVPTFYHPLIALLNDDSVEVQVATIRAAGRIRAPELVPHLVRKLGQPLTRWEATAALARCIGTDLSRLESLLNAEQADKRVRRQLLYLLRHHATSQAAQLLIRELSSTDERLRVSAYGSLLSLRDQGVAIYGRPLRSALRLEMRRAYELHVMRHDLLGVDALIEEALERRIVFAEDRILMLLDLLYPEVTHSEVRDSLGERRSRTRATIVELLDNLVAHDVREQLLPLFGPSQAELLRMAEQGLRLRHRSQSDHLRELARGDDDWLRSCSLHVIGMSKLIPLRVVVEQAGDCANPVVRETAALALTRLEAAGGAAQVPGHPGLFRPREVTTGDEAMPLSTLEKVFFLKSVPLFEDIPGEDIVGIVPILHEVAIPQGETFLREGEEGDALYIVVAGEILARTHDAREIVFHSREVIGERSVLTQQPRSADCTAVTDVVALRIDKEDFWRLMSQQPKITIEILKVIVDRYL